LLKQQRLLHPWYLRRLQQPQHRLQRQLLPQLPSLQLTRQRLLKKQAKRKSQKARKKRLKPASALKSPAMQGFFVSEPTPTWVKIDPWPFLNLLSKKCFHASTWWK
jgi:hypothetical protein